MNWVGFAIGSAFFAGLTAILGKLGVEGLNSNLATFIRTVVILFVVIAIITMRNEWQLPQHIAAKPVCPVWQQGFHGYVTTAPYN